MSTTQDLLFEAYSQQLTDDSTKQKEAVDLSTKAQIDQLAENRKLVEAEKQNAFRGAYVDYAKNINPYGVQSELAYGSGLGGAGKGETAQANYYNTYQNRLGEINTNATGQLRDIANQETNVRLAGDQTKLSIDSALKQQLASAQFSRGQQLEAYEREDKANAYNQLLTAITSAGYNPTDEELAAAGMTRDMANSYKAAYQRSLYSANGGGSSSYDRNEIYKQMAKYEADGDIEAAWNYMDDFTNMSDAEWQAIGQMYFGDDWMPEEKQETNEGPNGKYITVYEPAKGKGKIYDANGKSKDETVGMRYVWDPNKGAYVSTGCYA